MACMPFQINSVVSYYYVNADLTGASKIMETTYDFAVVDSNTLPFVFKHAPEVANTLHINTELSFDAVKQSHQEEWMVVTLKLSL